jgi:uncharacterized OB-fold protein
MKKCLFCEEEIPETSARTKFCSDACTCKDRKNRYRKPIVAYEAIPCKNCGKMFTPKQSNSVACGRPGCKAVRIPVLKLKKCLICGTEITAKHGMKYCSDICVRKHRKKKYDDRQCLYCGKMFTPTKSISKTCGNEDCLKSHCIALNKARDFADSGQEYEISRESVLTKCPRCERLYQRIYEPAWIGRGMPRVFCNNCNFGFIANQPSYNEYEIRI